MVALRPDRLDQAHVPFVDLRAATLELEDELQRAWQDVSSCSAFIGGEFVERFEQAWAAYCGVRRCVAVGNGTDAIELVFRAMGIGAGDEVIVPTNTFVATAEGVAMAGATPVFADVDPVTLLATAGSIEPWITPRTAAIVVVALFGQVPDVEGISALAARHGLALIEDAAQAHGATRNGSPAGSFGHAATFSFYPGKNLGAFGDAGAVVTDDDDLADTVRSLSDHGRWAGSKHLHTRIARNSRMDGLQAAILSAKLPALDRWNGLRRDAVASYRSGIDPASAVLVGSAEAEGDVHHLCVARVQARDQTRAALLERGIQTGIHYPVPCHQLPAYATYERGPLPVAERAAGEILSLPMFPHITAAEIDRVCECLDDIARRPDAATG